MEKDIVKEKRLKNIKIPIQVRTKEGIIITETKRISASEVIFTANTYLPESSNVFVTLLVPVIDNNADKNIPVSCNAKISSIEPITTNGEASYTIVLFFTGLSADDKKIITSLIERH